MGNFIPGPPGTGQYTNLTGAGGVLVKSGPGSLSRLVINTGSASSTIELFDGLNSSGVTIATVNSATEFDLSYGLQFSTGLYAEVVGTPNATIVFY
jgi:hypothetical protein